MNKLDVAKKQKLLEKAEEECKTCSDEYNCILEEARDPYFRAEVGIEELNSAKSKVKNELNALKQKCKYLQGDVNRLQKSIGEMSVTQEGYAEMIEEQGSYLNTISAPAPKAEGEEEDAVEAFDFAKATDSVQVTGAFDECPEIKRIERSSAKFQTAEQEAILRKLELSQVKISEKVPAPDSTAAEEGPAVDEVQCSSVDKSMFEKSASGNADSMDPNLCTPQRQRRGSVLLSANKNVIDTLNNMFSPSSLRAGEGAPPSVASNRNSIFSATGPNTRRDSTISTGSEGTVTLEKKSARSKTLQVVYHLYLTQS